LPSLKFNTKKRQPTWNTQMSGYIWGEVKLNNGPITPTKTSRFLDCVLVYGP